MTIRFSKMHGLGNDFVVIDAVSQKISMTADLIQRIANRQLGVGCDQVLLITTIEHPIADFGYRIFNADGSEAFQCGNGARCIGLFIRDKQLSNKETITLATRQRVLSVRVLSQNQVQVDMGRPRFDGPDCVDVGNPHRVFIVDRIESSAVAAMGEQLNNDPAFPEGVNVGFMHIRSPKEVDLLVFERGVGITQACGSGACAAVAIGRQQKQLDVSVLVHQTGGDLQITWPSAEVSMQMTGPAAWVFDGVFHCSF